MSDIVHIINGEMMAAVRETADGCIALPEAPDVAQGHVEGVGEDRAQKGAVCHENDALPLMSGGDLLQFSRGSLLDILEGFSAGRFELVGRKEDLLAGFRPLGSDLLEGKAFPLTEVHFAQIFRFLHLAAEALGNKACG